MAERPGHFPDLAAEPAQDAAYLALLVPLEDGPFGAEAGDAGRLDEDGFAGAAGAVDDALQLVAMVDGHGQDVMIAADRGVGIAQDLAELGIAEQPFDLVLHALIHVGELLADLGQLRAGHVQDVAPAVDAAGDALGDEAQVFDRGQECDQPLEAVIEPHAIAVHVPGASERVGDLQELLGCKHRADGGPAHKKPDIVQAAKGRRPALPDGLHHLGDEREFGRMFSASVLGSS